MRLESGLAGVLQDAGEEGERLTADRRRFGRGAMIVRSESLDINDFEDRVRSTAQEAHPQPKNYSLPIFGLGV